MYRSLAHALLAAALALAASGAAALPGDSDLEIVFGADHTEYDLERGVQVYRGNVYIERGGLGIYGDELVLRFAGDDLATATVRGEPVRFRQEHDGDRVATEAEARELVYEVAAGQIRLAGGVRVTQAGNEFVAEDLRYDVASERVIAAGESDSRIRVTIQPRRPPAAPAAEDDGEPAP